jgi:nucleoside transporter
MSHAAASPAVVPMDPSVRLRLSIMMFLQYFVWGSWAVEMGSYMGAVLKFSGGEIGWVYSSTAIAAMVSPLFMGYVADRLMATEKLLSLLYLGGAGLLLAAAYASQIADSIGLSHFEALLGLMILYSLLYMPTLALTNSISFANMADPEKDFPMIRVFGTLGWIAAGWAVGFVFKVQPESSLYGAVTSVIPADSAFFASHNFIILAAAASALLGFFCLTLPHTPPQANSHPKDGGDRRSVLTLLADRSFLIFVVCSFLICIPLAFYYNLANLFLTETKAPYPTALQTVGQISEVFFMAMMPFFIKSLGVKRMLAVGMLAWVVRYAFFASLSFPLVFVALLLHGICYDFFFVASQIYVDTKADTSQRASAQSFIAFVTLGVGMFVGAKAAGWVLDQYPPQSAAEHQWMWVWTWPAAWAAVTLAVFLVGFRDRAASKQ